MPVLTAWKTGQSTAGDRARYGWRQGLCMSVGVGRLARRGLLAPVVKTYALATFKHRCTTRWCTSRPAFLVVYVETDNGGTAEGNGK